MKNDNYEFIEEDHLPSVDKIRAAVEVVKNNGPWILDPLYGFMMDKNCEPIEFFTERGEPTTNFYFVESCNPCSVSHLLNERDAYRDLCGELIKELKSAQDTLAHCKADIGYSNRQYHTAVAIHCAITKAEKILGAS